MEILFKRMKTSSDIWNNYIEFKTWFLLIQLYKISDIAQLIKRFANKW